MECKIFRIPLTHVSDHLSMLFQFAWLYLYIKTWQVIVKSLIHPFRYSHGSLERTFHFFFNRKFIIKGMPARSLCPNWFHQQFFLGIIHLVRSKMFENTNDISYPLIRTCTNEFQGVRNLSFSEYFTFLTLIFGNSSKVYLKYYFFRSPALY